MAQQKRKAQAGWGPWPIILGLMLVGIIALLVLQMQRVNRPVQVADLSPSDQWEVFPDEGNNHVSPPERVQYRTDPPTSGAHYDNWARAKFYTPSDEIPPPEMLVHNLEHGNIVVYYDPERVSPEVQEVIKGWTRKWPGVWDGVLAVPRSDPEYPVILTAWRAMQKHKEFDRERAERFIDHFRGRGPENPVR